MSEDLKRNMDMMRATLTVVEVLAPFSPVDRIRIMGSAMTMAGCKAMLFADFEDAVASDPALTALLEKVRAAKGQG